jgi:hypothetical protein
MTKDAIIFSLSEPTLAKNHRPVSAVIPVADKLLRCRSRKLNRSPRESFVCIG